MRFKKVKDKLLIRTTKKKKGYKGNYYEEEKRKPWEGGTETFRKTEDLDEKSSADLNCEADMNMQ